MKQTASALFALVGLVGLTSFARQTPTPQQAAARPFGRVHDPRAIVQGTWNYLYCTGQGIPMFRSHDRVNWESLGPVFTGDPPLWTNDILHGRKYFWAPDIALYKGRYRLFYAASGFGRNRSGIGVVSNVTLDPTDSKYKWRDDGLAMQSVATDNFNAIDPAFVSLGRDRPGLVFGSFWSGIKLVALDAKTLHAASQPELVSLARRPSPDAIEAGYILHHGSWYYLLVSFDYCCRGVNSTYNIRIGRSKKVAGPYLDAAGTPMMQAGGTPLLATNGNEIGPGHCGIIHDSTGDTLIYHYYAGDNRGTPALGLRKLLWSPEGWPTLGERGAVK